MNSKGSVKSLIEKGPCKLSVDGRQNGILQKSVKEQKGIGRAVNALYSFLGFDHFISIEPSALKIKTPNSMPTLAVMSVNS